MPEPIGNRVLSGAVRASPRDTRGKLTSPNLNLVPAIFFPAGHFVNVRLPMHLAAANTLDRVACFAGETFGFDSLRRGRDALADRFAAFRAVYRREVPDRDVVHR